MRKLEPASLIAAWLVIGSCSPEVSEVGTDATDPSEVEVTPPVSGHPDVADYFADSTNIGRKGRDRIEMAQYRAEDSVYVVVKLFSIGDGPPTLQQEFSFQKDGITGLNTELADFNNDGFNDVTCEGAIAGRGANEIRRLWLYDPQHDSLVYITNSMDYPNLAYNERLNCIDAFRVYGGCSTDFLRISGDSLREFAQVELFEGLTVTTIDPHGTRRVIHRDTSEHGTFVRYKNFAPLEVNEDF